MQAVFDACRWLNQYLGIIGCVCVLWRLVPLVLDKARWLDPVPLHRTLVFLVLAGFELFAAIGAAARNGTDVPALWVSSAFTVLHASTICLCIWWPHPARLDQP